MLRLDNDQPDLWDSILPEHMRKFSDELTFVDEQLQDERFMQPFIQRFSTKIGRPTVPIATYLRLMYLKSRYQMGYELLVKEVNDSIQWRRFCKIPFTEKVPDSTTLIKLTQKYGPEVIKELNATLLQKLKERKVIRGKKLRMDTTVVESDIHYPTDASLLSDGVKAITRIVTKIKKAGIATRTKFVNRTPKVKKEILKVAKILRKRTAKSIKEIDKQTRKLFSITKEVISRGEAVLGSARRGLKTSGDRVTTRLINELSRILKISRKVVKQTEQVVAGNHKLPNRIVSIYDVEARPIRKGKLSRPTEFGHKTRLPETENGIISDYEILKNNPGDSKQFRKCIRSHIETFGKAPEEVAADRAFYSRSNERWAHKKGVSKLSIPKRGKKSKQRQLYERQFWFRRLQKWRAGSEARISLLKRKFGLGRSRYRGTAGTNIWVGWNIMGYNLAQSARLN